GAVDCARHKMKRPSAVGDLQLGEKYVRFQFSNDSSLTRAADILTWTTCSSKASYDIACQWHIWVQLAQYKNEEITIDGRGKFMVFLVPKFHL
ncbi:hypothetical protein C8J57DRAFT_1018366, partial [Mycena rebaudengoi]